MTYSQDPDLRSGKLDYICWGLLAVLGLVVAATAVWW